MATNRIKRDVTEIMELMIRRRADLQSGEDIFARSSDAEAEKDQLTTALVILDEMVKQAVDAANNATNLPAVAFCGPSAAASAEDIKAKALTHLNWIVWMLGDDTHATPRVELRDIIQRTISKRNELASPILASALQPLLLCVHHIYMLYRFADGLEAVNIYERVMDSLGYAVQTESCATEIFDYLTNSRNWGN